jgi:hypothetical protein
MESRRFLLAGAAAAGALAAGPLVAPALAAAGLSARQAALAAGVIVNLWRASEEQIAMHRLALRRVRNRRLRALAARALRDELASRAALDRLARALGLVLPRNDPGAALLVQAMLDAAGAVSPAGGGPEPWDGPADPALVPAALGGGGAVEAPEGSGLHEAALSTLDSLWRELELQRLRVNAAVMSRDLLLVQREIARLNNLQATISNLVATQGRTLDALLRGF